MANHAFGSRSEGAGAAGSSAVAPGRVTISSRLPAAVQRSATGAPTESAPELDDGALAQRHTAQDSDLAQAMGFFDQPPSATAARRTMRRASSIYFSCDQQRLASASLPRGSIST